MFDSFDAAIANYASKPPMAAFEPDALDAYVRHGFRQDGDHVRLKCDPDTEADTFHHGGNHTTWDRLGAVDAPVIVVGGMVEEMRPSAVAELAAAELPARSLRAGGPHGPLRPDDAHGRDRRADRRQRSGS